MAPSAELSQLFLISAQQIGLLSLVVVGLAAVMQTEQSALRRYQAPAAGLVLGLGAILAMLLRGALVPGAIMDAAPVLTGIAGAFFGPAAAVTAAALAVSYQLSAGGVAVLPGVYSTVAVALLGTAYFHCLRGRRRSFQYGDIPGLVLLTLAGYFSASLISADLPYSIAGGQFVLLLVLRIVTGIGILSVLLIEERRRRDMRQALGAAANRERELNVLLAEANERLSTQAKTDGLTAIPNRRAFDERLEHEWARASRHEQSLALLVLDVDHFKQYNDHFGHVAGDECLKQLAQMLLRGRRVADLAARIGGEEFCVLLPNTDIQGANRVAEAIRLSTAALRLPHPKSQIGFVTVSIGVVAAVAGSGGSPKNLLRTADEALYQAKATGRNRVVSALHVPSLGTPSLGTLVA